MFRMISRFVLLAIALIAAFCFVRSSFAELPRVFADGKLPSDSRLAAPKDLNGYFPFKPFESAKDWDKRAGQLKMQMRVALGLWPAPTKAPLNPVIHGRIERDDYTVERVYFESMPGFYVTGSLYRPKGISGKMPGVLCPHGHWANGRFYDAGEKTAKEQLAKGAEKFDEAARSPLQARCVHLARMGCVVFHYDMIGYADSKQISFEVAHRFAEQRPEMNSESNWGLYSSRAESHLQSVMGLQTWNSIRSIDFLESLEDVDPKRLAVTGASGGGTQTMIVAALDPRVTVSMPCVMVSTAMQGGCTCENCTLLRVGTGNIEFAALFAPKPQGMTAANDWTKEMSTKGFPELMAHYKMLGAPDNVMLVDRTEFNHNYNSISRAAMYRLFNDYLGLMLKEDQLEERDFKRLTQEEMTVWNDEHPKPEGGDKFERSLVRWWTEDSRKQLDALMPTDPKSLRRYREVVGGGLDAIIRRGLPKAADVEYEQLDKVDKGDYLQMVGLLRNNPHGEELPVLFMYPKRWESKAVIWIDEDGKSGLLQKDGSPKPEIARLVSSGASVVGIDLLYQGEFLEGGESLEQTPRVENPREFAGYTFGYNQTVFASRVHDILSAITFVRNHAYTPEQVHLVGNDSVAGPLVACARAQAGDAIDRAAIDASGLRFKKIRDFQSPRFLPGAAKYLDLPGILSLSAPDKLQISGVEMDDLSLVRAAYKAAGASDALTIIDPDAKAVNWLLAEE